MLRRSIQWYLSSLIIITNIGDISYFVYIYKEALLMDCAVQIKYMRDNK